MKPTTAILAALIFSSVEFAQAGVDVKDRSSYSLKLDTADVSDPAEAIQKAKQGGSTVSVDVRFPASGKAPFPAVLDQIRYSANLEMVPFGEPK